MTTSERGGRPAATSAHELSVVALRLFVERGYESTSVDQIAEAAGVSRRTFFRYFPTKADVLFADSPEELRRLRGALDAINPGETVRSAVRRSVLAALSAPSGDDEWIRQRAVLIMGDPLLRAHGHAAFDAWRRTVTAFVAARLGVSAAEVVPLAFGHAALAASLAAHEHWVGTGGNQLADSLAAALDLLLPGPSASFAGRVDGPSAEALPWAEGLR